MSSIELEQRRQQGQGGRPGRFAAPRSWRLKRLLQLATPPAVWWLAHRLRGAPQPLVGPLASWKAASDLATGWDCPQIVEQALGAALKVKQGAAAFERDSRPHERIIYSQTILAALLLAVGRYKRLKVVDFGGGLGSNYFQNLKLIRALGEAGASWSVVELPALARIGAERFETDQLRFYPGLAGVSLEGAVLLFTGSLQYVEDAFAVLEQAVRDVEIVALDRVLVSARAEHEVYLQHLDRRRFGAVTLPTWCFSVERLTGWFAERGFVLVEHFRPAPQRRYENCGMLFVRGAGDAAPDVEP